MYSFLYKRRRILHYKHNFGMLNKLNGRMSRINQQSPVQNQKRSLCLLTILATLGVIYFLFSFKTFRGLWYHKSLCILSTAIFIYLCEQSYFELYEKQIKNDFPNTLKKLTHYYNHYKGSIVPALEDTIARCPKSNRIIIMKIKEAIQKPDYARQIEELECKMPTIWLKMLCRLILFAKENGSGVVSDEDKQFGGDVISNNLKRLTNIVTYLNIEQGYNDAELLGMQVFVFFSPFLVVPVTRWYNANLLVDLNMEDIYGSLQAQSLTALLLLVSTVGALFIHWMRKLQN